MGKSGKKDNNISKAVCDTLFRLSVPAHMDGYDYLATAIEISVKEPTYISRVTKTLYPEVAKRHNSSQIKVEAAIRNAISAAYSRREESEFSRYFDGLMSRRTNRPTNSMFIATVARKIRAELMTVD